MYVSMLIDEDSHIEGTATSYYHFAHMQLASLVDASVIWDVKC